MKKEKPKPKKAILYARVACQTQDQKPDRLKHQIDTLLIHCQDHNIEVEGIFMEVAQGTSFERKEFQRMLKDIKRKKVNPDLLLTTETSRFSRNLFLAFDMIEKLKKKNIKVDSLQEINYRSVGNSILNLLKGRL